MMVVIDDSRLYLLASYVGRPLSDFGIDIEDPAVAEEAVDAFKPSSSSSLALKNAAEGGAGVNVGDNKGGRRLPIFRRLKEKVKAHLIKRIPIKKTNTDITMPIERENTNSSYDETSIFEQLKDNLDSDFDQQQQPAPAMDSNNETVSTMSTWTNQKKENRLLRVWRLRMSRSMKKKMRDDAEKEIKGEPVFFPDSDDYAVPPHHLYNIANNRNRNRNASALDDLRLPRLLGLDTSNETNGDDDGTENVVYSTDSEFPLYSSDIMNHRLEVHRQQEQERGLVPPMAEPALYVSFEDDCAQLVFETASYREDAKEDPVETECGVEVALTDEGAAQIVMDCSNIEESLSEGEDPSVFSEEERPGLGAYFPHPSVNKYGITADPQFDDPSIQQTPSSDTEFSNSTPKPLGATFGFDRAYNEGKRADGVWSESHYPKMEGDVTDPPSPTQVEKESYWCLGWSSSNESEVTITDVLLDPTNCRFDPCFNDIPPLPGFPFGVKAADDNEPYPYDEDAGLEKKKHELQRRDKELSTRVGNFVRGTLGHMDQDKRKFEAKMKQRTERPVCHCIKCTATNIYNDLLECNGGSLD